MSHDQIITERYTRAQIKAARKVVEYAEAGREAKAKALLAKHGLVDHEAVWIAMGVKPEVTDTGLALMGGWHIGAEHPQLFDAMLQHGVTTGHLRIAEALDEWYQYGSETEWLGDPLVRAALTGAVTSDRTIGSAVAPTPTAATVEAGYSDAHLDVLHEAATLRDTGAPLTEVEQLLTAADLAMCDVRCAMDGDRPQWTDEQLELLAAVPALHAAGRPEARALASAGLDLAHAKMAARLGLVVPLAVAPGHVQIPQVQPVAPPTPASEGLSVKLPSHLDIADPSVRARVEAKVEAQFGAGMSPVVMWPREPATGGVVEVPVVLARPGATRVDLVDAKTGAAELLAARLEEAHSGDLVLFDPHRKKAVAAHLDPRQRKVRSAVAARLGVPNHAVEVALHMDGHRVDQLVVLRAPLDKKTGPERQLFWSQVIGDLPGGSSGWLIDENEESGVTRLVYGPPPRLPDTVLPERMLPPKVTPDRWHLLPLGVMPDGQITGVDLSVTPHSLIVGPTGSGKTVLINMFLMGALAQGHRLHILDPIKGVDFMRFKPYATSFSDTLELALAQIQAIYEDIARRKEVLKTLEYVKWDDVPAHIRAAEGLVPETIVIDEYTSLVAEARIPAGLPKEHPLREEIAAQNAAKGIIGTYVGKIAREARFVGSHLAIGTQRPDAKYVDGEMREQLGAKIQLLAPGKPVSREALGMVFSSDQIPLVHGQMLELDDGKKGLALVAAEGGSVAGFRVAFSPDLVRPDAVQALLDRIGVPRISAPWDLASLAEAARVPEEGEIIRRSVPSPAPQVAPKIQAPVADTPDAVSLDDLEALDVAPSQVDELPPIDWGEGQPAAPATVDFDFEAPAPPAPVDEGEFGPAPLRPMYSTDDPFG